MSRRILIVGTVPYNEKSTSRAFASYFCGMPRENLAQIFSNTKKPVKGHCNTLYQITDQRMLKRRFDPKIKTGVIYNYEDLGDAWESTDLEVGSNTIAKMYNFGKKKNSLVYLIRKFVWKKKYWCTKELNDWMDRFNPECVFLSFSDDFFIPQIALYVAEKYDIPIISSIGDDYYFNYKKTISPLYHWYKLQYRALIRKIFRHPGSAIYIGNKIRDKYNSEFGLNGETVYLTSSIQRREFKPIDKMSPVISYFGNIRLGRNESLNQIGLVLGKIDSKYRLHVYSNETDPNFYRMLLDNPNVEFHGSVPYAEVQKRTIASDIIIVVEGFKKKDVDITRYSLSTKVADSLASGVSVLAYGSSECGAIEYCAETGCIVTCTNGDDLFEMINRLINDTALQHRNYVGAEIITEKNHRLIRSADIFRKIVERLTIKSQAPK